MFKLKKISTKDICMIAMLIALTAILGFVSGKLRIGTFSKFSFNFISVYFTAVLFGPVTAGFVGLVGDFISAIGTGPYLWMIGLLEFVYGFIFGILFYNKEKKKIKGFVLKALAVTVIIAIVDIFAKSFILLQIGYAPSPFAVAVLTRLPMIAVMAVVRFVVLIIIEKGLSRVIDAVRE